jgi:predicted amino acid-binding ACT domain protein
MATTAAVRRLLAPTSLPDDLVDKLLAGASAVWLMGQPAELLAGDLVLCHPPLAPGEVRAVARATNDPGASLLSVVTEDRPGLLADLAAVLANQGVSITDAVATVLPGLGLALQRVTAIHADGRAMTPDDWEPIGRTLRAVLAGASPAPDLEFVPLGEVSVVAQPQAFGRALVTIEATDRVGLLWAVAAWFAQRGCNVEAYHATSTAGAASGRFLVEGACDWSELAVAMSGGEVRSQVGPAPLRLALRVGGIAATVAAAVAVRAVRTLRRSS